MLGRPLAAKAATGKWSEVYEFDNCLYDSFFQETEDQLRAAQFTVKYLPLWLTYGDLNGHAPVPKYYNLSFNNVVIENYVAANGTEVKNVFMPTFSDPTDCGYFHTNQPIRLALEEAAEKAWQSIGFKVTKIERLEDLAYGGGSIHCITKVLKRSNLGRLPCR